MERPAAIVEEYDGNHSTGIECEEKPDLGRDVSRPYDPRKIRVDSKQFSIAQTIDMIEEGELDIAPEFQRRRVWKKDQKSLLIESILLRIPLPVFYFSADEEGRMQVVDGVQRLSAIQDFRNDKLPLEKLEYLQNELKGKCFEDILGSLWSRRFLTTPLTVYVIDPQTPDDVKFDIFRRLNTGGTPLNEQEIRHCISKKRTRDFLSELVACDEFQRATSGQLKDHVRMADLEMALRYSAFALLEDILHYSIIGEMGTLLTETVRKLDNPSEVSDERLRSLKEDFAIAMDNAHFLFEEHAFRKWHSGDNRINPFNRALFDVWSVSLARIDPAMVKSCKKSIVDDARQLMTDDPYFVSAITSGTSKSLQVMTRFEKVRELLDRNLK